MFDEPSSYLDIRQRLRAAQAIRSMVKDNSYVIVVEHDLSVLDYLSDFICCLYGTPSIYGVVTMPYSVREGINIFLAGFIPSENLRYRWFLALVRGFGVGGHVIIGPLFPWCTFVVGGFRFRDTSLSFKVGNVEEKEEERHKNKQYSYPAMSKTQGDFKLDIDTGGFSDSEIIVMLGQNGKDDLAFEVPWCVSIN